MGVSFFVSKRYFFSKSKFNIVNFISLTASFVLVVASCSFFIVLSVFSGLKDFGLNYNKAFDPDIKISSTSLSSFTPTESQLSWLSSRYDSFTYAKTLEEKVFLSSDGKNTFGKLVGVDKNFRSVIEIDSIISVGRWVDLNSNEVLVSYFIADKLNLGLFNYGGVLSVGIPNNNIGSSLLKSPFRSLGFVPSGVYSSSNEKDQRIVFSSLNSAQSLLKKDKNEITSILIKSFDNPKPLIKALKKVFNKGFLVSSREELNQTYYKMLNVEGLILNILMGLILVVAMFNSVGAIIILIVEKRKGVQTLLKLGATKKNIQSLFFKHGLMISFSGGVIGLLSGICFVYLQKAYSFIKLAGTEIPYPVSLELSNVMVVIVFLLIVCGTGAYLASKTSLKIKL
jgi:lipoprotein-releasing system permease protein